MVDSGSSTVTPVDNKPTTEDLKTRKFTRKGGSLAIDGPRIIFCSVTAFG